VPLYKERVASQEKESNKRREEMGGFERQVKQRTMEVKVAVLKGVKVVGDFGKKTWRKVKTIKR
jgi:hypothetical protein